MTMQVIEEGPRNLVARFYGAGATTVDVSALSPPCTDLRIMKVIYDNPASGTITIAGDATTDLTLLTLHSHAETACFDFCGGIPNNAGAGKTGDMIVTISADSTGWAVIHFKKIQAQAPFPN